LDCCFSGAFAEGMGAKSILTEDISAELQGQLGMEQREPLTMKGVAVETAASRLDDALPDDSLERGGRVVLASSTEKQQSFEERGSEISVYTKYLVQGLETGAADTNQDGEIWAQELHEYAKQQVKKALPAMEPEIYVVREGYRIRIAQLDQGDRIRQNNKQAYRLKVQELMREDGEFSPVGCRILRKCQQDLQLSAADVDEIEEEEKAPLRVRQENLKEYEEALREALDYEYPLGMQSRSELKQLQQQHLKLRDEDVLKIASRLESELSLELGLELGLEDQSELNEILVDESLPEPDVQQQEPVLVYPTFEFEVVRLDPSGKVINRQQHQAEYFSLELSNGVMLDMVSIPGGTFWMGSPDGVGGDCERPRHQVAIAPFFMSKFAITQEQYEAVIGKNPSNFKGTKRPVEQVSWFDAIAFCEQLSQLSQRQFTLPSEAQWEYACRAGTETPFYFGETISTDQANYDGDSIYGSGKKGQYREQTTDVGTFPPNLFGLYDMHGNVSEWCADHWRETYQGALTDGSAWETEEKNASRLLRGGSWYYGPGGCRSAYRDHYSPDCRDFSIGFRVACV
jgi:formylglycine-generating enzyme required for sulfatase activity